MKVKRYLVVFTPVLLLLAVMLLISRQLDDEHDILPLQVFIGVLSIAQGIWRPQLDRYLRPEKPPETRWDYQWMRAFMVLMGIGWLSLMASASLMFIYLMAFGFLLNPVFYWVWVRRSGEQARLREMLSVIGVALFGLAVVTPFAFIEFTGRLTWTACVPFVPGLLLILISLLLPSGQTSDNLPPDAGITLESD